MRLYSRWLYCRLRLWILYKVNIWIIKTQE